MTVVENILRTENSPSCLEDKLVKDTILAAFQF